MSKICYVVKRLHRATLVVVDQINGIVEEYVKKGFDLTVRQVFYQLVSRAFIENTQKQYKRTVDIVRDARLAGLIDWQAIVDRTRYLRCSSHWDDPAGIIDSAAKTFVIDKWSDQKYRPEVWIEKDALVGILQSACEPLDVPYFSCRGNVSWTELHEAFLRRFVVHEHNGQKPVIFHLGDHDPNGIDMSRDIVDRLAIFGSKVEFHRIALNMDQVQRYQPPPNPAKETDKRFKKYKAKYGAQCWELDALAPETLVSLIQGRIKAIRNNRKWKARETEEAKGRETIQDVAVRWDEVQEFLEEG